jgi:hypothetical protein
VKQVYEVSEVYAARQVFLSHALSEKRILQGEAGVRRDSFHPA